MSDEVRPSDIEDLKTEDRNLHARITRNADQSREDNQRVIDKMDEIQKSINQMSAHFAEVATQVSNNSKDLEVIKETQRLYDTLKGMIDVQAVKVLQNTDNRVKWDKRVWSIMIMMIIELIGLVFALYRGG